MLRVLLVTALLTISSCEQPEEEELVTNNDNPTRLENISIIGYLRSMKSNRSVDFSNANFSGTASVEINVETTSEWITVLENEGRNTAGIAAGDVTLCTFTGKLYGNEEEGTFSLWVENPNAGGIIVSNSHPDEAYYNKCLELDNVCSYISSPCNPAHGTERHEFTYQAKNKGFLIRWFKGLTNHPQEIFE